MSRPADSKRGFTAVLAAGGTGGHMFPAQALARVLLERDAKVVLITDKRGGGFGPDLPQVETWRVSAAGVAGGDIFSKAMGALRLGWGVLQARSILKRLDPDAVVGFGGYASVPTVFAAGRLGTRVVLHEQNAGGRSCQPPAGRQGRDDLHLLRHGRRLAGLRARKGHRHRKPGAQCHRAVGPSALQRAWPR